MCSNRPWKDFLCFWLYIWTSLISLKCGGFKALASCYLFSLFSLSGFGSSYTCLWFGCCFEHFNFSFFTILIIPLLYSWAIFFSWNELVTDHFLKLWFWKTYSAFWSFSDFLTLITCLIGIVVSLSFLVNQWCTMQFLP